MAPKKISDLPSKSVSTAKAEGVKGGAKAGATKKLAPNSRPTRRKGR